ncbi:endonuclease [Roseibium sp. MMSF_3544]|uniref:endonuclease n=1 Tax=unclassified Roseibium TaxID=2629323 RepID=UPI00273D8851|nr:endonuclease [Roseibium sp. MMSF_3544]
MNFLTATVITLISVITFLASVAAQTFDETQLRANIHATLKQGHSRISYTHAYDALEQIFEDPANPENLILFYTNRSQKKSRRVNQDNQNGWNREHLWPQSHGAKQKPVKSDLHHLRHTDATVNSRRGSLDFDDGGSPEGEAPDTFKDHDSFEPRDAIKGDVARAMFYIDVRYEGTGTEPDLVLVDQLTGKGTTLGDLCTLLDWHLADPPDAEERRVNEAIEQIQDNRNIFVDQPELATLLFGTNCGVALTPSATSAISSIALAAPTTSTAMSATGELRLATWNIENFWHVEGEHLRPNRDGSQGTTRYGEDYKAIRQVIEDLDADVIGLQEIGAPAGVRLLFPSTDWDMVFSKRLDDDLNDNPDQLDTDTERDIYTAVVVRRDAAKIVGTERIALNNLGGKKDRLREGTAVLLEVDGEEIWVASIHLKSGCFSDNNLNSSGTCRTLAKQIPLLEDWLDRKSEAEQKVALLGDFNRQIDRANDVVRKDLDDGKPVDMFKVPHRQQLPCTAFNPSARTSIDYVIINEPLWAYVTVPPTPKFDFSDPQISDHCPVFVDVKLNR